MPEKSVVVVIPCEGLNAYVRECLAHCLAQDYPAFTVALLPDAPLRLPAALCGPRLVVLPTGPVSIGAKRNAALRRFPEACCYALVDSDAYPATGWLSKAVSLLDDEGIWAVGGPNITPPSEPLRQRAVGNALCSVLVSGTLSFTKRRSPGRFCRNLHSCNLVLARRAVENAGLFNERLRTAEDREYCLRIGDAGGRILFDPEVVVYHHNRRLWGHFFRQRFTYGQDVAPLLKNGGGSLDLFLLLPSVTAALLLGGLLSGPLWRGGPPLAAAILALYLLAASWEAARHSNGVRETALAMGAIVTAHLALVAGQLLGLAGIRLGPDKAATNFPGATEALPELLGEHPAAVVEQQDKPHQAEKCREQGPLPDQGPDDRHPSRRRSFR